MISLAGGIVCWLGNLLAGRCWLTIAKYLPFAFACATLPQWERSWGPFIGEMPDDVSAGDKWGFCRLKAIGFVSAGCEPAAASDTVYARRKVEYQRSY